MPMKNPPHPGLSVRLNCLDPFSLSVTEGAKALGVSRTTLSRLINGQAGVSPDMAIRLAKAFGATPDIWRKPVSMKGKFMFSVTNLGRCCEGLRAFSPPCISVSEFYL